MLCSKCFTSIAIPFVNNATAIALAGCSITIVGRPLLACLAGMVNYPLHLRILKDQAALTVSLANLSS